MVNRLRRLGYYLTESGTALVRHKALHAFAIFVITLSLFILGFSRYLTGNINNLISGWSRNLEIRVFLDDGVSRDGAGELAVELGKNPIVKDSKVITPEEALTVLEKIAPAFGQASDIMGRNPLPLSISLKLKAPPDLKEVKKLIKDASGKKGVSQVIFDWQWMEKLRAYSKFVSFIGWLLFGALGVAAIFTVAAITRILALSRKEEIAILNLVGATSTAIRSPFIAGGAMMGFVSGVMALLLLVAVHYFLRMSGAGEAMIVKWVSGAFLSGWDQFSLVSLGTLLGAVGGGISIGFTGNWE